MNFYLIFCLFFVVLVENSFAGRRLTIEGNPCLTSFGDDGFCTSSKNCKWIKEIPENDWTLCDNNLICCKNSSSSETYILPSISTPSPLNFNYNRIFYTPEQCKELSQQYSRIAAPWEGIAHGEDANPQEFPFAVCGGTIISKRHVLTAAHCITNEIENPQLAVIKYGSVVIDETTDNKVSKVYYNLNYKNSGSGNDIAIYLLEDDIQINGNAFPACLYHGNDDLVLESIASIVGFGQVTNKTLPKNLQKAQINIKNEETCKIVYELKGATKLLDHQICAGDSQSVTDTCKGDSGGPLIQKFENISTVVGITSYGSGFCDSTRFSSVYTRVSSFISWIEAIVQQDFKDLEEIPVLNPRIDV
ncbi:chymotrypsinogen A-like isoform X2 [Culicoides brevitarsis]|uniref:chymotrypsinogen A-like isoform X2 n=1 Tax=Culicoides brevitarsis TaxID=469753 RepID=UPI00307C06FF